MKTPIAYKHSTKLLTGLSILISLTFIIVWLPFLRSIFDGISYQWGLVYFGFGISGAGVTPSFIFVILQLLLYAALLWSMYWVKNRVVFRFLLAFWWLNVFGNLLSDIIINGGTMFHGDTLNVHVSLTWIVVPLSLLALFLIYRVIRQDQSTPVMNTQWSPKNRIFLLLILGPVAIEGVLFSMGEPDGVTDQIGVFMALAQAFLIPLILRPSSGKEN